MASYYREHGAGRSSRCCVCHSPLFIFAGDDCVCSEQCFLEWLSRSLNSNNTAEGNDDEQA